MTSKLLICGACKAENRDGSRFCEACGALLTAKCAACGHQIGPASRFCSQCGVAVGPDGPAPTPSAVSGADGERKRITVLFADIKDSTALIESDDPEDAIDRIGPVIAIMKEAVHQYDGIVNEVLGDGILAFFGTPKPREDHAACACLAALAMQAKIGLLAGSAPRIRVGIHTGEVVLQSVHATLTTKVGAIGQAVHVAARMEQMAEAGQVLVTSDTYEEARQFVEAQSLGQKSVKGVSSAVDVYRITSARSAPASEIFRTQDRLEPLTGRDAQLEQLQIAMASAEAGHACVVSVVGEAGMGKSRLCFEFAEECRRRGVFVLEARVARFGQAMPFQPILDLLRDYFGIRAETDAARARTRVRARLEALAGDKALEDLVLDFLGIAERPRAGGTDAGQRKAQLIDFVCGLARYGSGDEPALVVIDDLHWIDAGSAEFVDALADAVFHTRTMLLLNFRSGLSSSFMQRSHYRQINLSPLDPAASSAIIVNSLGLDGSIDDLRRELSERAQGNPLFLQELIRAIIEGGGLQGVRGSYRASAIAQLATLPPNVQGLLAARVDRLDPVAKQVLQAVAVAGRETTMPVLTESAGLPPADVDAALRRLRRSEMLVESRRANEVFVTFNHPLVQEVAYRSLLSERKRTLHAAVARAMRSYYKDSLDEHSALIAYHLEQAGDLKQASQLLVRSAIWLGANDPRQALTTWKKVAKILAEQPSNVETDYIRMMACGQVVNFGWREGMSVDEARGFFDQASGLATTLNDMRANALIHAAYGRILAAAGSADEYVDKVRQAQELAGGSSDASLQVTLNAVLCHALRLSGRLREALAANDAALARVHELGKFDRDMLGFDVEIWMVALRGRILVWLGRGEDAVEALERVIAVDRTKIDAAHRFIPHLSYVEKAWSESDAPVAGEHAAKALEIAASSGTPYVRVYAQWSQGLALATAGEHARAASLLREALDFAREKRAGLEDEARLLSDLSRARLALGMAPRAFELADEAVAVARKRNARALECYAHIARAAAARALGRDVETESSRANATRLMEETGAKIFARTLRQVSGSA